jgi:hypothetical protein
MQKLIERWKAFTLYMNVSWDSFYPEGIKINHKEGGVK